MQTVYLSRLPSDLQSFVAHIERMTGIEIIVEIDDTRVGRHAGEPDPLACFVNENEARLFIPAKDCFPDGSVLHELLHIHRFLVDQVPQIAVYEEFWSPEREKVAAQLDNNLEHLVIVTEELRQRPERRGRWVNITERVLNNIRSGKLPNAERDFFALFSSVFIPHVLAHTELENKVRVTLGTLNLVDRAAQFSGAILPVLPSKESMTHVCVEHFSLSREYLCFEYFDPRKRNCRREILG